MNSTFAWMLDYLYQSISVALVLYIIYCIISFFLYGKKCSHSIGDDIRLALGLISIPLIFAMESKVARAPILQSFFIFCIGGAFIYLRQAYFRIIEARNDKLKNNKENSYKINKGKAKHDFIRIKAKAFAATRRSLK